MHIVSVLVLIVGIVVATVYGLRAIDRRHELMSQSPRPDGEDASPQAGGDNGR